MATALSLMLDLHKILPTPRMGEMVPIGLFGFYKHPRSLLSCGPRDQKCARQLGSRAAWGLELDESSTSGAIGTPRPFCHPSLRRRVNAPQALDRFDFEGD